MENKNKDAETKPRSEATSVEKLELSFDDHPVVPRDDLYMEMLEFLIDKKKEKNHDVTFYLSMRDHFFTKGFLSPRQREYIVKGLAELLNVKHFVPKKVT